MKVRICNQATKDGYLCGNPLDDEGFCNEKHGVEFNKICKKEMEWVRENER